MFPYILLLWPLKKSDDSGEWDYYKFTQTEVCLPDKINMA
jgi:hypothetical protein